MPLGGEHISLGIRAGFYSSLFVGLFASIFGGTPSMISGPKATITLLFSSVIASYISAFHIDPAGSQAFMTVLTVAFFVVFLGGILQALFGIMRLGSLIKFIPYPVIAGFLNGTAILIIYSQLWTFLGIARPADLGMLPERLAEIQPLTMLIGTVAALVMWRSTGITRLVPGSIIGVAAGLVLYYILNAAGFHARLGPIIGYIPTEVPAPVFLSEFVNLFRTIDLIALIPFLLPAAFSIALLGSIDSLLTSLSVQSLTDIRSDTNRELLGQGIGNLVAACFGGIAGAGHVGCSSTNYHAGGRTRLSGIVGSLTILAMILLLSPAISIIPKAVVAGIIIVSALRIFDPWMFQLLRKIYSRSLHRRRELLWDFFIISLVMLVTVFFNLVAAVIMGILVSILTFVAKMSRSTIRRTFRGSSLHSRKQRDEKTFEMLQRQGGRIAILELEGSIFFGSADNFAREIDKLSKEGVGYIILDMKRVNEIDSTGARILCQLYSRLQKRKKILALSYLEKYGLLWQVLDNIGLFTIMDVSLNFPDTDLALEFFEDRLLIDMLAAPPLDEEKLLKYLSLFQGLREDELKILAGYLLRQNYSTGEKVFRQGDTENSLYIIVRGTADVTINLPGKERKKRLQTLAAGTFFGEMALLDGKPRSANVEARDELSCYRLSMENFEKLRKDHPQITIILLTNISRTIANRLRLADDMIMELEM